MTSALRFILSSVGRGRLPCAHTLPGRLMVADLATGGRQMAQAGGSDALPPLDDVVILAVHIAQRPPKQVAPGIARLQAATNGPHTSQYIAQVVLGDFTLVFSLSVRNFPGWR